LSRTAAQTLVGGLERHGTELAFCVPGESYISVLDALHDSSIRLISTRHEAAAANMAEAYGKLTGRPGVCLVTRGPGSTHASVGIHTAWQDSTPLLLLVGQVPRRLLGTDAFQEMDYERFLGSTAKAVFQPASGDDLAAAVARGFRAATEGRPGPVVIALPEDVLVETTESEVVPLEADQPIASDGDLQRLRALLEGAERPLVVVGEGGWSARTAADVVAFCEGNELPVAASFRCQDYVDNTSRCYAGHLTLGMAPTLAELVEDCDLLLAIGGRLGDISTRGYSLLGGQTLVHVHPDAVELRRVHEPALAVRSTVESFAALACRLDPVPRDPGRAAEAHENYLATLCYKPAPGPVDVAAVMEHLRGRLPPDAILCSGAGNFTVWAHRFYAFRRYGTQLAPQSGAMGYGLPAALAARALHPDRIIVCLAGDGDLLMSAGELGTAMQYDLPVVIVLVNNGMYGTIRMHQERKYPGRVVGTDLVNPDFVRYAESFGAFGEAVERTDDFPRAFERALAAGTPALLELRVDPEALAPGQTLSEARASGASAR
jgi:acetolactate synthase I/II/III large subunit